MGGVPGPPTRNPAPRIHRCPGVTVQHLWTATVTIGGGPQGTIDHDRDHRTDRDRQGDHNNSGPERSREYLGNRAVPEWVGRLGSVGFWVGDYGGGAGKPPFWRTPNSSRIRLGIQVCPGRGFKLARGPSKKTLDTQRFFCRCSGVLAVFGRAK